MLSVAAAVVAIASALAVAMRAQFSGSWVILAALGVPYALFSGVALWRLARRGELGSMLRPRSGDLTYGAVAAALLFCSAWLARMALAPHGTAREGWLVRVYLQIGNPEELQQKHFALAIVAVVLLAILEELTWRGHVLGVLTERIGARRAWPLAAVLYALAHAPTVVLLKDPFAGPNPLVVLAAMGCGLVWGVLVATTQRLPVAIFSHALFLWLVAIQFPLWRLG